MDLPFLNNDPPAENAGGDFWNLGGQSSEGGYGDDVTLNELLALYQSANEAAPPFAPISEPEAYPAAPAPEAAAEAPANPWGGDAPAATPFVPSEPIQSNPWGGEEPAATPFVPAEPIQSSPWGAEEPAAATPFVPAEPIQSSPWGAEEPAAAPPFAPAEPAPTPWGAEMAPPQPMAWETAGDAPSFDIPAEPVFEMAPVFEAPAEVVAAPIEPLFPEPAVVAEPVLETAPAVVETPVFAAAPVETPPPPIEVSKVVPAPIKVQPMAMTTVGDLALVTPEARREASGKIGAIASEIAQGIDAVQEQLNTAYEKLANAAASRAPVTDIVSITSSLSEIKGQISEESPIFKQALALRQMADAYLELLKSL